jgi:hypothetical protein
MFVLISKGMIILLLLLHVCTYAVFTHSLLTYPYDWAMSEGDHIYYATRILNGETLYKDAETFPLLGIGYPPGYQLLLALPVSILGPSLFAGRILALSLCILFVVLLYRIARKESGSILLGCIVALSVLAYGPVSVWFAVVRMESLFVLLVIAGMVLVARRDAGRIPIILAAMCFAGSFFTKQLGLFGLGAAGLFLVVNRKYRTCAELAVYFALITIPSHFVLDYLTDGHYSAHIFGIHLHRQFSWARGLFLVGLIQTSPVFMAMACYEILSELKDKKLSAWAFYLACSLPVALLIFYDGVGANYFLPFYVGVLILAGMGAGRILSNRGMRGGGEILIYVLIMFQLLTFAASRFHLKGPVEEDKANLDHLAQQIQRSADPVLVDRMGSLVLGTEHEDYFIEPVLLGYLYYSDAWEPGVIVSAVEEQKFSLIYLFDRTQFVPPVIKAVRENYQPISSVPVSTIEPMLKLNLIVYVRKPR